MKRLLIIISLCFTVAMLSSQTKTMFIPAHITKHWNYDSVEQQQSIEFKITQLSKDTSQREFYRIKNNRYIIETWKENEAFGGQVMFYIWSYVDQKDKHETRGQLHTKSFNLTPDTAKLIFEKVKKLDSIPDYADIPGWGRYVVHGTTYSLERSTKTNYSLRTYFNPEQSNSVPYKNRVYLFTVFLNYQIRIIYRDQILWSSLPDGLYTDGFTNVYVSKKLMESMKKTKVRNPSSMSKRKK